MIAEIVLALIIFYWIVPWIGVALLWLAVRIIEACLPQH